MSSVMTVGTEPQAGENDPGSTMLRLRQERDAAQEEVKALWKAMKQYVDASRAFDSEAVRLQGEGVGIRDACIGLRGLAREETKTFTDLCRLVLEQEREA